MSVHPQRRPVSSPFSFAIILLLAGLVSCDTQTEIEGTIPADASVGVNPRNIVAIQLNNSITDDDTNSLDPTNFIVKGDLSTGTYSGTLSLAPWSILASSMTVEQFATANSAATTGVDEEAPKKDAIVFLLPSGTNFKDGEIVTVTVKDKVTAHTTPVRDGVTFTFQVKASSATNGELLVSSTSPSPLTRGVATSPRILAAFNRAVRSDGLSGAIAIRGAQTGAHTGGTLLQTKLDGTNRILEVLQRLADGDVLAPGEDVSVTFSSSIQEAGTAVTGTKLTPYHLRFQAESGLVQGGWESLVLPSGPGEPVAAIAGDFRPTVEGMEIVELTSRALILHYSIGEEQWTQSSVSLALEDDGKSFEAMDMVLVDTKEDGSPDLVVLLGGENGSRLQTFQVSDSGTLSALGDPVDFRALNARKLHTVDLDANGKPELFALHPAALYVPSEGADPVSTGFWTLFELKLVAPDASEIDLNDPDTLVSTLKFQAASIPVPALASQANRMDSADLDGDGKFDLAVETTSGLFLFKNAGSSSVPLALRAAGSSLLDREGNALLPAAWTLLDAESDGDIDVLAWDAAGAILHRNRQVSAGASTTQDPAARSLLVERPLAEPVDAAGLEWQPQTGSILRALDLDGDFILDLLTLDSLGNSAAFLGRAGAPLVYDRTDLDLGLAPGILACADVNGDSGLDVIGAASAAGALRLLLSRDVDPPTEVTTSTFAFASEESGLTDLSGTLLRVAVVGDLTEVFTGYTLALDYDESVLVYKGFEAPSSFDRKATFTLCPDASLQGCSGYASAKMAYNQSTKGAPSMQVLLGTFLFQRPASVTTAVTTTIELESFQATTSTKYENVLTVAEGDARLDVAATIENSPLSIALSPPAPADLALVCSVVSRNADSMTARATWSSPSNATFTEYQLSVGGGAAVSLPASASSYEFSTSLTGSVGVSLTGVTAAGARPTASCAVIGVHKPTVTCVVVSSNENLIQWTISHAVDRFVIFRNGARIGQTADGSTSEYSDKNPSPTGADNYEVLGVLSSVEGPRGACEGGPIGDPDTEVTLPPAITEAVLVSRVSPTDANTLRVRWTNGEGYDAITVVIERAGDSTPVRTEVLSGTSTLFTYVGDTARGGVAPHQYTVSLTASSKGRASETVRSSAINVPVPAIGVTFTCSVDGSGNILARWATVWPGYTGLKLRWERLVNGSSQGAAVDIPLDLSSTEYLLEDVVPSGLYDIRLVAEYSASLPAALVPSPQSLQKTCQINFAPKVKVGTVETGIGLTEVEIPVVAEVFGTVDGFYFELEYPSFFVVDPNPLLGLRMDHEGPSPQVQFTLVSLTDPIRQKAIVQVDGISIPPDADGDGKADGSVVLASIVGRVPSDPALAGSYGLPFSGLASLRFGSMGNVSVLTQGGGLVVRKRFLAVDTKSVVAGSQEEIPIAVRPTITAPSGVANYRIQAFQLQLTWDPAILDLLPVTESDQADTAVVGKGTYILPNDASYATARLTGALRVSWLGFDFANPTEFDYLYPGVELRPEKPLLRIKFRSKVSAGQPATFAKVELVDDASSDLPTALFPDIDVPSEPDLDGLFPGGVRIESSVPNLSVRSIRPARGVLTGGGEAVLSGTGFLSSGTTAEDVDVTFILPAVGGGSTVEVPVVEVLSVEQGEIRIRVPSSGRNDPSVPSTVAGIRVSIPGSTATLESAYTYDYPRLTSADLTSFDSAGGDLLVLRGFGLHPSSTASFRVPGLAATVPAQVSSVEADGTRLQLLTPDLRGQEGKFATVEVVVPGLTTVSPPGSFEILDGTSGPTLKITSVVPSSGTICGALEVTIVGEGFLPGLTVRFGGVSAAAVDVVDSRTLTVTTPSMTEGTGTVDLQVSLSGGSSVTRAGGFAFEHPAPVFMRGDVNEDGAISISDVVVLSELTVGTAGTPFPANLDAVDANDDGVINGGDVTAVMNYLFASRQPLPAPFATEGLDPTPDSITSCDP